MAQREEETVAARRIRVRGQVQGVGFRPFVWRIARAHGLCGEVSNDAQGVDIFVQGRVAAIDAFLRALRDDAPPIAEIDAIEEEAAAVRDDCREFVIAASRSGAAETRIAPDLATCGDCVEEIFSPGRRQGYAFTNCTNCGPRFSIVVDIPYDRANTTMSGFAMCGDCRAEYDNPADRRFHAQPIACPACGPQLSHGIGEIVAALKAGKIVAIKGLGGFHLACDAGDEEVVARLRARKRRPAKPLALMAPDVATIRRHCHVSEDAAALLADPAAPIVLLPLREGGEKLAPSIAPGLDHVGWMLPMTPLHHLLMRAYGGPLVMTSGNESGRPQVIDGAVARRELAGIADMIVDHDRPIARRIDDSVAQLALGRPRILRRARGYAPAPLHLPPGFDDAPPILATGGDLKAAFALARGREVILSHHLGDLDDAHAFAAWRQALDDLQRLFDFAPQAVAVDAHPGYRSGEQGRALAARLGVPLVEVAHHHAHMAAVMAENGVEPAAQVAAIVMDGIGMDGEGRLRGAEVLVGGYAQARFHARLAPAPLPGGDAAAREPWRNLLARLDRAGLAAAADELLADKPLELLRQGMAAGINAPLISSAGRLFDAVAAALGVAPQRLRYEGEAAMRLEALARRGARDGGYPFEVRQAAEGEGADVIIDDTPMWRALLADLRRGVARETVAWRFHEGLAQAFAQVARQVAETVALSGGVMANALLLERLHAALRDVRVLSHAAVPPGDGGLALGQAAVAAARLARS